MMRYIYYITLVAVVSSCGAINGINKERRSELCAFNLQDFEGYELARRGDFRIVNQKCDSMLYRLVFEVRKVNGSYNFLLFNDHDLPAIESTLALDSSTVIDKILPLLLRFENSNFARIDGVIQSSRQAFVVGFLSKKEAVLHFPNTWDSIEISKIYPENELSQISNNCYWVNSKKDIY